MPSGEMYREEGNPAGVEPSWVVHEGRPDSPVVIHVPHGSMRITEDAARSFVLDEAAVSAELRVMTDFGTDVMAQLARQSAVATPWVFENRLSRLVIDPERLPDDIEEMAAVGMGAVYVKTSDGRQLRNISDDERARLIRRYFEPYAAAMTELVTQRLAECGQAIVIDLHSYPLNPLPYELRAEGPRPHMCLGTSEMHTPTWLVEAARRAFDGFGDIGLDSPFPGAYVPLEYYEREPQVRSIMLEIRRDTYMASSALAADGELAIDPQRTSELVDRIARFVDLIS